MLKTVGLAQDLKGLAEKWKSCFAKDGLGESGRSVVYELTVDDVAWPWQIHLRSPWGSCWGIICQLHFSAPKFVTVSVSTAHGSQAQAKSMEELHKEAFTKLETVSEMVTRCPLKWSRESLVFGKTFMNIDVLMSTPCH